MYNMVHNIENTKQSNDGYTDITTAIGLKRKPRNYASINIYILVLIAGLTWIIVSVIFTKYFLSNSHKPYYYSTTTELGTQCNCKPKYWILGDTADIHKRNGIFHNLYSVLERLGYEKSNNETAWNLLWSHKFPYSKMHLLANRLQPHQKVNHFPGIGCLIKKSTLSTSGLKSLPKSFRLPTNKTQFLQYASENKNATFVVKDNNHRHVMLKNVSDIDLEDGSFFVQEYVQRPLLVNGYKFDIGVYVVLTSVNPLRVYAYKGDVAIRYCLEPYYPFDPKNLNKYVIAKYRPTWVVPALTRIFKDLGFSHKDTFETYMRSKGIDVSKIWEKVDAILTELFITKEKYLVKALEKYESKNSFFELMRVDMLVDEELEVYLMEANMSPNLSSGSFPPNTLLFQQILYNLFNLVGVASPLNAYHSGKKEEDTRMISADNSIAVWGSQCNSSCVGCAGAAGACALCRGCLPPELRTSLLRAHTEHLHKGDFRRLVPPFMIPNKSPEDLSLDYLSPMNKLQYLWYQGKCNVDNTWCI